MKKTLFAIFAAASLLACSKSETIQTLAPEAITFDNAFVDNATKANDAFTITESTLEAFQVYGTTKGDEADATLVPIFDYVTVEKNGTWKYADNYTQYWVKGNTYNFAAVVNVDKANVELEAGVPAKIKCDVTEQKDILFAANEYGVYSGPATSVPFTFKHLLSKVFFTFKNTMTSNTANNIYSYRVSNIVIKDAVKTATGTVAGVWTADANSVYDVEFGNITKNFGTGDADLIGAVAGADESTSLNARLMIPQAYTALKITCTIETLLNGKVIDVENYSKEIPQTFAAGSVYNFILAKGNPGDKIEFTVSTNAVNGWATGSTPNNL